MSYSPEKTKKTFMDRLSKVRRTPMPYSVEKTKKSFTDKLKKKIHGRMRYQYLGKSINGNDLTEPHCPHIDAIKKSETTSKIALDYLKEIESYPSIGGMFCKKLCPFFINKEEYETCIICMAGNKHKETSN